MAAILNPAPPWRPNRSDYVVLWHGCTAFDKNNIEAVGITLSICKVAADFGQGFYTTTVERQARQWAWSRYYEWRADPANSTKTGNQPVVLRFRVRRHGLDGLDRLLSMHFVLGDFDNEDFWSLVQHCRHSTPARIHDQKGPRNGWYDMVTGPVAAFWRQRVSMNDADQISFHTSAGVRLLNDLVASGTAGNRTDYRWEPVP